MSHLDIPVAVAVDALMCIQHYRSQARNADALKCVYGEFVSNSMDTTSLCLLWKKFSDERASNVTLLTESTKWHLSCRAGLFCLHTFDTSPLSTAARFKTPRAHCCPSPCALMSRKPAADAPGDYRGDVYYTRNFWCVVKMLNGQEWRSWINVRTAANQNHFTLNMIIRELRNQMQLPANRNLYLDDSWHSFAPLPASLPEKYVNWFFIEKEMPGEAAVNDAGT